MGILLTIVVFLCSIFFGVPIAYHLYMRHQASRPWKLDINKAYAPCISILIPMYNEERMVELKIENLCNVKYPKDRIQVIFINDASTDGTLKTLLSSTNRHRDLKVKVLNGTERLGKSAALNLALKYTTGDIIIVSDADCFWPSNILKRALPYLADANVGAITGREILLNPRQSWVTKTETSYNDFVRVIRLGESKTHSTIFFQGGFAAYKRNCLKEFDSETDDSGTALSIVQSNLRTLVIPKLMFYTMFPSNWKSRIRIKIRRATQLLRIWSKCLKLQLKRKLILPKRIFLPEAFLYILNPIFFIALIFAIFLCFLKQPPFLLAISAILGLILLVPKGRILLVETIQDNCILLIALVAFVSNKKFDIWKTAEETRLFLEKEVLEEKRLI